MLLDFLDDDPATSVGIGLPDGLAPPEDALHIFAHPNDIDPKVRTELNIEAIVECGVGSSPERRNADD